MKMLTATSALRNKVVTPNTRILDSRYLRFGNGTNVQNSDHLGKGRIPVRDVIAFSRNVAVSRIAARLGSTTARASATLYKTWHQMGIGVPTGIDIPGEVAGIAYDPSKRPWAPIELANHAFGQGVSVTPIQLASAYTPMINGGLHVQPHFLVSIGTTAQAVAPPSRVLPKGVAGELQGSCTTSRPRSPGMPRAPSSRTTRWAARRALPRSGATTSGTRSPSGSGTGIRITSTSHSWAMWVVTTRPRSWRCTSMRPSR